MFWGLLNGVLIGILVYSIDRINISTWNHRSCKTNTQFFLKFHLENQHTYCLQVQYAEPFVFIWGNLHNETKRQSWTTPKSMKHGEQIKTKCLPSFMHHFSRCPSYKYCISHSTGISGAGLYDHDRKSVTFFRVFWWQTNLHEKISFRFCKSSIYSIIFWFFVQMQKDLNEKRSCKYSRPFWILSLASKSSSFPGLLDHKMLQASWKSIDRVRSCCCKTGEENAIKLFV